MGFLDHLKNRVFSAKHPTERGQYTPRLVTYKPGHTTLAYSDSENRILAIQTPIFLFDYAYQFLESSRRTVATWQGYDLKKIDLTAGCDGIPSYWWIAYSGGFPIDQLCSHIGEFLKQCEILDSIFARRYSALPNNRIEDIGANFPEPLLHLGWLVGLGATKEQIARYLEFTGKPGQDALFDRIVVKLGFEREASSKLRVPSDYRDTLELLDAPDSAQPKLMKKILQSWIKSHFSEAPITKPGERNYIGYWATDLALIAMMWNIDDSSFSDHPYYPRELVMNFKRNSPFAHN